MRTRGTAIVLLVAVGFAVALLVPAGSTAYRIPDHVYRWPHAPLPVRAVFADFSIITYYDVSAFRWSVARGARAWNAARTGYFFLRVSRRNQAAVIVSGRRSPAKLCDAHTDPGFPPYEDFAKEFPRRVKLRGRCDRKLMVLVAAHELGHVLGLDHDDRHCAVMNVRQGKGGRFSTPTGCPDLPRREYWRRPVRPDDIRGVKELYYNDIFDPDAPTVAPPPN